MKGLRSLFPRTSRLKWFVACSALRLVHMSTTEHILFKYWNVLNGGPFDVGRVQ
jgi:hypothetical protein